jgi:predicted PurR-regulated permease PerM
MGKPRCVVADAWPCLGRAAIGRRVRISPHRTTCGAPARRCCDTFDSFMLVDNIRFTARSNSPQRIIAMGIVFACLYWASSVVMTLLLAILAAYVLDPLVELLERVKVPRALGSLLVLLIAIALLIGLGYLIVARTDAFAADWPRYSQVLRRGTTALDNKLAVMERQVGAIAPGGPDRAVPGDIRAEESQALRELFLRGVGSLYSILLLVTFLPFLIFFMLAGKKRLWNATLRLFPEPSQASVEESLSQVSAMLRGYVVGNALVGLILMFASGLFFWTMNLDYPFIGGVASGLLNLIPYLGAVLAWLPPFLIGMAQWQSVGPFLWIAGVLAILHIIALNLLVPAMVGRRVQLNALAVTIALLFWGWLWGAIGLILAIPITATIKVVCDHVEEWQPIGRWLGV